MSAPDLQPTWNATHPVLPPHIIHEIEKQRREREQPAQIPLHDVVQEVPPGWEPDPENGGYRREEPSKSDDDGWGYDF